MFLLIFVLWLCNIYPSPRVREGRDYMCSMYLCFCCLFWVKFFSHLESTLLKRWAVPQSAIFCFSYKLGLPGILLNCLSLPLARWYFKVPYFLNFYFQVFVFLFFNYILWLICLLSVGVDISFRRHIFILSSLTILACLLLFIFLSTGITKSQGNVALLLLLLVLIGVYAIFPNPIFHTIYILSNECNVLFYHVFLYILLMIGLTNQTLTGQLIQLSVHTIYI